MEYKFLTVEEVKKCHSEALRLYGGSHGLRSQELLESAVFTPQNSFDGEYLYNDLFLMAGVYFFHIGQNQAFIDGNKRTGVIASFYFLEKNGIEVTISVKDCENMAIKVASGEIKDKEVITKFLRDNSRKSLFLY